MPRASGKMLDQKIELRLKAQAAEDDGLGKRGVARICALPFPCVAGRRRSRRRERA